MFKIDSIKITQKMLDLISKIDEFKGFWKAFKNLKPEYLFQLKKVATIESIASSNRIEGNKLTDEQVETILNNLKTYSFRSRDEQEIGGYALLMQEIFENYEIIPFNENYIKQFHKVLLSLSDKDERHRGEYKKLSNSVAAFDNTGKEIGIIFETVSPFETPEKMRELITETNFLMSNNELHPLILTALFVVHFLAIHPFQDGNGRMSRALTTLLLLKNGYTYVPYSSMETIIEDCKSTYYASLRKTQISFKENINYEPWIIFFLTSALKQVLHLKEKIEFYNKPQSITLNEQKILNLFATDQILTSSQIIKLLDLKEATIKSALSSMVKKNLLIKSGSTKGAWYRKFDN